MLPKALVAASLRPIILTLLDEHAMYGYEITQRVRALSGGKLNWPASKLYPLLHDLENKRLVEAFWRPSEAGPKRKYYGLTAKGRRVLAREKQAWMDLNAILARLWQPELNTATS